MFKEKYNYGKGIREKISRKSHSSWKPAADRPTVKEMIEASNYDRLPDLIPLRHSRMSESPFVFYRATASLMARDLFSTPSTGIFIQASGDCHLKNFGGYATPERHFVLDMNDFDETHPAHFEWDLKRLATSFALASREKGFKETDAEDVMMTLINDYATKINEFSAMKFLDLWYLKFDLEELQKKSKSLKVKARLAKSIQKSHKQSHDVSFYKMTNTNMGKFVISDYPPLILHPFDLDESMELINQFMEQYKNTLQPDRKYLFEQYKLTDVALKVVGVGSVGTRCYIVLLLNDNNEPLFIQVKEARQSVLEQYTSPSKYNHNGERIVQGQRLIQSASDIFLGWSTGNDGRQFYFRQLKDRKISAEIESFDKFLLKVYAGYCANVLARAHCKTGQGATICGKSAKEMLLQNPLQNFLNVTQTRLKKIMKTFLNRLSPVRFQSNKNLYMKLEILQVSL